MSADLRVGDVVRYKPERTWCHTGMAVAEQRGKEIKLFDTYWITDRDIVHPTDYEVLFNLNDYDEVKAARYENVAPADRQVIRRNGDARLFVRKGAADDKPTMIANAEQAVEQAENKLRYAQNDLHWARRQLAEIKAGVTA